MVIPTINRLNYLKEAVESVRKQDYDEIELLIIDGGSNDGTKKYLESIRDEETKIIRRESPKGQSNARNKGIAESEGDFILFLDDDDVLRENAVSEMKKTLQNLERNYVGVFTSEEYFGNDETRKNIKSGKCEKLTDLSFGTSCTMFRTEVFENMEGFNENLEASEDLEFLIRIFSAGYYLYGINEPLYNRRIHDKQLTKDYEKVMRANYKILNIHHDNLSTSEVLERFEKIIRLKIKLGRTESALRQLNSYKISVKNNEDCFTPLERFKLYEKSSRLYNKLEDSQKAAEDAKKCEMILEENKNNLSIEKQYLGLRKCSNIYRISGEIGKAISCLNKAFKLLNMNEEALESSFLLYRRLGLKFIEVDDFKNARRCFKASIKKNKLERFSYYYYFWSIFGRTGYETGRRIERIMADIGLLKSD